jgi:hypothetical protein
VAIREELRSRGYEVFEVRFGDLSDDAMARHFYRLGRILLILPSDSQQDRRHDGHRCLTLLRRGRRTPNRNRYRSKRQKPSLTSLRQVNQSRTLQHQQST